ncbi:MAG TPA: DinB family protein [Chryseolinea sp.]|nr:DinB family protein [Chryseolinea sp.]
MKNLLIIALLALSLHAFGQGQFQKETAGSLGYVSSQVTMLAAAIPADKYSWTPETGVRSVAEVLAHIVSANYFFASKLGGKIPEGVKMETLEKDLKTKEALAAELKRSYETIVGAIKNASDAALAQKVEFPFPGEFTGMSAALIALNHTNEHLGQLIAYSRMNDITPPWSQAKK